MAATTDPTIPDAATPGRASDGAATAAGAGADLVAQLGELLTCTSWRLRRAARGELEPLGLTFGQARALRLLSRAEAPLRMGELAVRLEVVPRSATAMVDALEAASLVERRPDPLDRRSVLVCLTGAGDELLARLGRARRASAEALFARLDGAQCEQLLGLLAILNERDAAPRRPGAPL